MVVCRGSVLWGRIVVIFGIQISFKIFILTRYQHTEGFVLVDMKWMKWLFVAETQAFALEILIFSISEVLGALGACTGGRVSWGSVGGVGVVWG